MMGWKSQLLQLGVPAYYCPTAVKDMERWVRDIFESSTASWILDRNNEMSACELELCSFKDGRVVKHIIDRTFVHDGCRWVIDYKLGEKPKSEPQDLYIDRMTADHAEQLSRYAELASEMGDEPVRTAIFCIATQDLIVTNNEAAA